MPIGQRLVGRRLAGVVGTGDLPLFSGEIAVCIGMTGPSGPREALRMSRFLLTGPAPPLPPELWQTTHDVSL